MMKVHVLKSVPLAMLVAGLSSVGFAADYWASSKGGGAGTSEDDPMSLTAALEAAKASGESSTVHLADDEYKIEATILLDGAITLAGATRDGVKINSQQKCSAITITSHDAVVTNLTVMNGKSSGSGLNCPSGSFPFTRMAELATGPRKPIGLLLLLR